MKLETLCCIDVEMGTQVLPVEHGRGTQGSDLQLVTGRQPKRFVFVHILPLIRPPGARPFVRPMGAAWVGRLRDKHCFAPQGWHFWVSWHGTRLVTILCVLLAAAVTIDHVAPEHRRAAAHGADIGVLEFV